MTLPLPKSFDFTVRPEHINVKHRCNTTKCIMAAALNDALPEDSDLVPSFGSVDLMFRIYHPQTWHQAELSDALALDETAKDVIYFFDTPVRIDELKELIGDGLTFTVDTEQMIVRKKEG